VPENDWLVGGDRSSIAAERIYDAAAELIERKGLDAFDIDALASRVHCSRATIYRHAGGRSQIINAVLARDATRIVDSVRLAVADLSGPERLVTSIMLTLKRLRTHPLGQLMASFRGTDETAWITESPVLAGFATEFAGLTGRDPHAAQWVIRVVLSLLYWPAANDDVERQMLQRFVTPAFDQ